MGSVSIKSVLSLAFTFGLATFALTASALPEGYTLIGYVETTGNQYVKTGYTPNANTKIEATFALSENDSNGGYLFGRYGKNSGSGIGGRCQFFYGAPAILGWGSTENKELSFTLDLLKHDLVFDKGAFTVDGTTVLTLSGGSNCKEMLLFVMANNKDSPGLSSYSKMKLYSMTISENGVIKREFVPAIDADGNVGLYDMAHAEGAQEFYTSATTTPLVAGMDERAPDIVSTKLEGLRVEDGARATATVVGGEGPDTTIEWFFGTDPATWEAVASWGHLQAEEDYAATNKNVTSTTYYGAFRATYKSGNETKEVWSETNRVTFVSDQWTFNPEDSSVSDGIWTFSATDRGDGTLSVGACTDWPDMVSPLDFGRKVVDKVSGGEYTIVSLLPAFGGLKSGDLVGKEQGGFVGALTLPPAVTNIGAYAFGYCTNATGVVNLPSTLTTLGDYAFAKSGLTFRGADFASLEKVPAYCFKDTKVSGEANLANATSVTKGAFENVSSLRSVKFGPKLTSLYGDYNHGAFHGCSSLTNVTFDADSCFRISGDNVFAACAALKKIDLCGVTSMTVSRTGDYKGSHFKGCGNLAEIDLGPALTNLARSAISIDSQNLKTVVFKGKVPDVFGTPYLWGTGQTNVLIKTYIHSSMRSKKNAAGKCWRDYAANGEIAAPKKDSSKNTTFAVDYIEVDLDGSAAKRQLLTLEPDSGLLLLVK